MGRGSSRVAFVALACVVVSACSLLTDLGGNTGGDDDSLPAGGDAGASDGSGSSDGTTSNVLDGAGDTTLVVDTDGADGALPPGVLSKDSFDPSCASWKPYNATVAHVSDAFAGAGACRVCLTTANAAGGITRSYDNVGPGTYVATGRVKNVSSTDWRITIGRGLDGGSEAHYVTTPFTSDNWQVAETSTTGTALYDVSFWFGDTYQPGDCALVDEVTVRIEP